MADITGLRITKLIPPEQLAHADLDPIGQRDVIEMEIARNLGMLLLAGGHIEFEVEDCTVDGEEMISVEGTLILVGDKE